MLGSVPLVPSVVFVLPDCPPIAPDPVSPNPYLLRACMLHAPACLALLARSLFFSSSPSIFDSPFFSLSFFPTAGRRSRRCKRQTLPEPPHAIPSPRCVRLGHYTLIAFPTRGLHPSPLLHESFLSNRYSREIRLAPRRKLTCTPAPTKMRRSLRPRSA